MLELEHLQKSFDGVPVLKDISLQVEDGEIVSILGPSGCGKTTLLNMILGIVDADQGAIRYNGEDLTRTPMEKRGFNIVFQDYALFPNLNVQQNITYGLRNKPGTGYTDSMMHIVVPRAAQLGYAPDFWISPDGVGGKGRPYPYMIFENLKALEVSSVKNAVKVGDTVSDIQEGVSAGVWSVGVVEGSSVLGLSQGEYEALTPEERRAACCRAEETFRAAGAHFVLNNLSQLPELIRALG